MCCCHHFVKREGGEGEGAAGGSDTARSRGGNGSGEGADLMQVGGCGGEKVAAECCLCPRVCLSQSTMTAEEQMGGQLFTTKVADGGTHTHTHTDTHDIVPLSFQAFSIFPSSNFLSIPPL